MVYPLHGDSAVEGESTSGYPAREPPINKPSERHPESDGGGIRSVVRIRGTIVALVGKVRGRSLWALIDSGSTGNYLNARCQTALELRVKSEDKFERLILGDGSEVHAQGCIQFILHRENYKTRILTRLFPNLHEELIRRIPWLGKENPTIDWATE